MPEDDEVILEIPEQNPEEEEASEWIPPVLKKAENSHKKQSIADVFFIQYIICIVILTVLFSVRLWDEQSFQNAVNQFESATHAESLPWVLDIIEQVKQLWN
ncbi:MAG: hypothetical protein IJ644_01715 [Oscillospiraceae bacterium]|nr:hypothetical protein [Oscillospiraceae bacterium]